MDVCSMNHMITANISAGQIRSRAKITKNRATCSATKNFLLKYNWFSFYFNDTKSSKFLSN